MMFYVKWTPIESPQGSKLSFLGSKVGFSDRAELWGIKYSPFRPPLKHSFCFHFAKFDTKVHLHTAENQDFVRSESGATWWVPPQIGALGS